MDHDQAAIKARFEQLFASYYGDLVRFASRRVGIDAASDVVSNAFLIAWRRLADVPVDHERAWPYATARRVIANELRGQFRRTRLDEKARATGVPVVDDHAGRITEQLRVRAVLDALSPQDQEVLRLTEWDGLGVDEAARVLGCTRTAFKVRLHRARRRFAARLATSEAARVPTENAGVSDAVTPAMIPEGNVAS